MTDNKTSQHKTIKDMFASYNKKYVPEHIDWGQDVGKEILDDK